MYVNINNNNYPKKSNNNNNLKNRINNTNPGDSTTNHGGSNRANAIRSKHTMNMDVSARTPSQRRYVELLRQPISDGPALVIGHGVAGSGKTFLAVSIGIEKLRKGEVDRLVLTRPAVCVEEEDHGALPGDLCSKMMPYLMPMIDVLTRFYTLDAIKSMVNARVIEVCPMAYMRGRTFERAWVLMDEAQNATRKQMIMMLTRIGHDSRLVLAGDPLQHDRTLPGESSGLRDLLYRMYKLTPPVDDPTWSPLVGIVRFDQSDIQRNPLVAFTLVMYGMCEPEHQSGHGDYSSDFYSDACSDTYSDTYSDDSDSDAESDYYDHATVRTPGPEPDNRSGCGVDSEPEAEPEAEPEPEPEPEPDFTITWNCVGSFTHDDRVQDQ